MRQPSDEEVLAPREPGTDPDRGGEAHEILTHWNLEIAMED